MIFLDWFPGAMLEGRLMKESAAGDLDRDDARAAQGGAERAYERLVRRHERAVAKWMWRFTRDRAVLDELTQEVFVEAWFSLKSFRGRSSFSTWLLAIATRVGYAYWRKNARERERRETLAREAVNTDANEDRAAAAAEELYRVLERLSAGERLVLTLQYFEELSVREIAQLTGWSESLVKVRAYRARRRLRSLLESEGPGRETDE